MAEIKWIKLSVNMFDDEKIKLIRTMPEGDKIVVIWVQILCLAGKINDGGLVYMGQNLAYSDEMLATILNHPVNIMRIALKTLEQFGMIEVAANGLIDVSNWEKHQSTDKMAKLERQNRERQQRYYYRSKLRLLGVNVDAEGFSDNLDELKTMYESTLETNVSLTLPNDTEVRSKKLEVRSKKLEVRSKKLEDIHSPAKADPNIPYKEIIDFLNLKTNSNFRHTTKATQQLIKARFAEGNTLENFKQVIEVKANQWLNDKGMNIYLRPQTLFGTKFESYLNEKNVKQQYHNSVNNNRPDEVTPEMQKAFEELKKEREKLAQNQ